MAFVKAIVVFSTLLCCAVAVPAFLFPNLQEVLKRNAFEVEGSHMKRAQIKGLSVDQKCDKMSSALQNLVKIINKYIPADQIGVVRAQIKQTTGMDISNQNHINEEACKWAGVSNLAEFAKISNTRENTMRDIYPSFVESVQVVRSRLRKAVKSPYIPSASQDIYKACIRFYDAMDEVGLLNLQ